ncbi:MAG TPA: VWA domain-containing protein [Thermoanaerobaculia bacterium]|nr:VWA domain-containing protein [Thermoanaerobaculia bacterium]
MSRDAQSDAGELKGVVDLTVDPGYDNARVNITLDGAKIAESLHAPYKVTVDFGTVPIEHRIGVTVWSGEKKVQWHETVNRGHQPLSVKVAPVDLAARTFEAKTTAPDEDPIVSVALWDSGKQVAEVTTAPYRFTVPQSSVEAGFVQVTAKSKSGEEVADFWSTSGEVHTESVEVRTVPIFVSVIDGNGQTRDDVTKDLFKVMDNGAEGKILEFGKAFDQPISIALLLDSSASMTYEMKNETQAAQNFVQRTLKPGDRCVVYAVRDVPRRAQELTTDQQAVMKAMSQLQPGGQTALYDAIEAAIRDLKNEKNRRAIVALTDGGDTSSIASFDELDRQATEAGIPIYFIAYDTGDQAEKNELDRLNYLAGQTGGFVVTANAEQHNLQAKYAAIERDLRAQFAIRYQITDFKKPNAWRKVRVVMSSPKLTARTIRGYFAP